MWFKQYLRMLNGNAKIQLEIKSEVSIAPKDVGDTLLLSMINICMYLEGSQLLNNPRMYEIKHYYPL
jgi:hypothetical protein